MNFFAYRLPGSDKTVGFRSKRCINLNECYDKSGNYSDKFSINEPGFIAWPFDSEEYPAVFIPSDEIMDELPERVEGNYLEFFPGESTDIQAHREEIEHIQSFLEEVAGTTQTEPKVVAARVKLMEGDFSPRKIFERLTMIPGENFIFCFFTPATGLWIGASPELLLRGRGNEIATMSLAGTRKRGAEGDWDVKNLAEQRTVTDFILSALRDSGVEAEEGELMVKPTGEVEHLVTHIHGILPESSSLLSVATRLSPTPALSGYPREKAMKIIGRHEQWPRAWYGGFCGPITEDGNAEFYVNLRSGCFIPGWAALYAGGGITLRSDAEEEWEETERKLQTMLFAIKG